MRIYYQNCHHHQKSLAHHLVLEVEPGGMKGQHRLVQAPTLKSGGMKLSVDRTKFVFQSEKILQLKTKRFKDPMRLYLLKKALLQNSIHELQLRVQALVAELDVANL